MSTTGYLAIALSRKLVLLTRNHRDLGKVPRLLMRIGRFNGDRLVYCRVRAIT
ncbi:MAG: hypothetical protein KME50_35150 [Nostoc desertorum CM1-VF14]|jgi:hypothetical protein|nr:hypothetical protein [Nostoc desertorum CM1-VF14]